MTFVCGVCLCVCVCVCVGGGGGGTQKKNLPWMIFVRASFLAFLQAYQATRQEGVIIILQSYGL